MSDRWASLLANAAGGITNVPPSFPNVLKELEPIQARILDRTYAVTMILSPELRRDKGVASRIFALDGEVLAYHVDNLARLNLVSHSTDETMNPYGVLTLTAFGAAFVRACRAPGTVDPPPQITTAEQLEEIVAANRQRWSTDDQSAIDSSVQADSEADVSGTGAST